jgi:methylated-DNA-[protein]-cysteine S-methyltransferase
MAVAEVWYSRTDSPIGALTLVATPAGLAAISFGSGEDLLDDVATRLEADVAEQPARLDAVRRELDEYFAGERQVFEVPLDRCLSTGFRRAAQEAISRIPYGAVASYGDIAAGAGQPGATRAAGTACRTNPIPVVVPCHRVLRSDGSIGGYAGDMAGGLDIKRHLLALEGARLTLFVP